MRPSYDAGRVLVTAGAPRSWRNMRRYPQTRKYLRTKPRREAYRIQRLQLRPAHRVTTLSGRAKRRGDGTVRARAAVPKSSAPLAPAARPEAIANAEFFQTNRGSRRSRDLRREAYRRGWPWPP